MTDTNSAGPSTQTAGRNLSRPDEKPLEQYEDELTTAITEAVTEMSEETMASRTPLHESVDVEALAVVLSSIRQGTVRFNYDGYEIVVGSNGGLIVYVRNA